MTPEREAQEKRIKHVVTCKLVARQILNVTHACLHHSTRNQQAKITLNTNKKWLRSRDVSTLDVVDSYFQNYYSKNIQ